jgi:hypothetical protein
MNLDGLLDPMPRVVVKGPRILTIDLERVPGRFRLEGYRGSLTIEGDFWDLSQWKSFLGRRLRPDEVTEWPQTICAAWRWYGERKTHFSSTWGEGGRDAMLKATWEAWDDADIVYGHNVKGFDGKKLNTDWRDAGLPQPRPVRFVDTLTECRRVFGDESMTLAALTQRMGIETKTDKYEVTMARAAVAGDVKAQRRLERYNRGDIAASEALVDRLRGWINHPNLAVFTEEEHACSNCGSPELKRDGWNHTAQTKYAQYRCQNCGAVVRNNFIKGRAVTRKAR